MRIAALYDIHGNLPALEAVLDEVESEDVDLVVVGGDVVWGPMPRATLDTLLELGGRRDVVFIRGNADREVAGSAGAADPADAPGAMISTGPERASPGPDPLAEITAWVAGDLTPEQSTWLGELPSSYAAEVSEGKVLFCHGLPRSDEEAITHLSPEVRLREALRDVSNQLVVCGHTHMQFERRVDEHLIFNAGSIGLPYQGDRGAFWLLLGSSVEFRRSDYDIEAAAEMMRATRCPHVDDVFISTLLEPPSADQTARHFEQGEVAKR